MDISQTYINLSFEADKILGQGNLVDAFYGDRSKVKTRKNISKEILRNDFINLRKEIQKNIKDEAPYFDKTFLTKQIDSIIMQLDVIDKPISYKEAVERMLDIKIEEPQEESIKAIQDKLQKLIKGNNLKESVLQWREDNSVSAEKFVEISKIKIERYKKESFKLIERIFQEINIDELYQNTKIRLNVEDTKQGWSAYNYYKGNYQGEIGFNSKMNFNQYDFDIFLTHEAFPGHHMQSAIREYLNKKGLIENYFTINLINTPDSVIQEGIGDSGYQFINIKIENENEKIQYLLDRLNVEIQYYVAYQIFQKSMSKQEALEYIFKNRFDLNINESKKTLSFVEQWKYYIPTYKYGKDIVTKYYKKHGEKILPILYTGACKTTIEKYEKYVRIDK